MKLIARIAAAVLALSTITACGNTAESPDPPATRAAGDDCGYAEVFEEPVGTTLFSRQVAEGVERARSELGVTIDTAEPADIAGIEDAVRAFAAEGCYRLIVTQGFLAADAIETVAREFPEQRFAILDATVDLPNVSSVTWATHQASYLFGYAAAKLTTTRKIGILIGMDIPPLWRFRDGFIAGAEAADPSVEVLVDVVGAFNDPAKGLTLASAMRQRGVDVLYPLTGSNNAIVAAANDQGYRLIAVNPAEVADVTGDNSYMSDNLDVADSVYLVFKRAHENTLEPGASNLTLADGVFAISPITESVPPYTERVPADLLQELTRLRDDIIAGRLVVEDPLS
jgi:basic membrane protein A